MGWLNSRRNLRNQESNWNLILSLGILDKILFDNTRNLYAVELISWLIWWDKSLYHLSLHSCHKCLVLEELHDIWANVWANVYMKLFISLNMIFALQKFV